MKIELRDDFGELIKQWDVAKAYGDSDDIGVTSCRTVSTDRDDFERQNDFCDYLGNDVGQAIINVLSDDVHDIIEDGKRSPATPCGSLLYDSGDGKDLVPYILRKGE